MGFISPLSAQTISNPSFETDTGFNAFPGYSSGNTAITDWSSTTPGSTGLNKAGNNPFGNNGAYPDGANVAFLQSIGSNLSSIVTGLTPGTLYKVTFRTNARTGNVPTLRFDTDGVDDPIPMDADISAVGGSNPFRYVAYEFRATATTQTITISNPALRTGDQTVVVDDFKIAASTGAISYSAWRDDASAGVSPGFCYTHAYSFGGAAGSTTVNGVGFAAVGGGNPAIAGRFSTTGFGNAFGGQNRNMTGNSNVLGQSFVYGGPNMSITLNGLKPNTAYVANIYGVAFDVKTTFARAATFYTSLNPADKLTVNLDHYDQKNGIYVSFAYTTDATGTVTLNYDQLGDGSWHTAAFCNREAVSGAWSQSPWRDDASSGVNNTFTYTHAYNFGSGTSPTINGVAFTGVGGANPTTANLALQNFSGVFPGDNSNVTAAGGGSQGLATDFIYNGFPGIITLSNLTPGQSYLLSLFSVGWEAPGARQAYFRGSGGQLLVDQDLYGDNNGTRMDYHYVADATGTVTVTTNPTAGASIHLYALCNRVDTPSPASPWSVTAWTGNSTTGVNSDATYTHAFNFGTATSANINGVTFTGVAGGNPSAANFATQNLGSAFNGDINNISGGSGSITMATDFVYGGSPGVLRLTGLTPGKEYLLSLFSVGWEAPGSRYQVFTGPDGCSRLDQDVFGDNNGIRIDYRYIADATGTVAVSTAPEVANSTLHLYGFCNREYIFFPSLKILSHPENAYVTAVGSSATFNVAADGQPTLTYQWNKGGNPLSDDAKYSGTTTATLTINNVGPADVANYTVSVTGGGAQGTITSNPATIILATDPVPGLFNTGVGLNCALIPDGGSDPHYLILTNPDGESLIPALAEDSTQFPIVAGPWIANSSTSKWIGPRLNTSQAAGQALDGGAGPGIYVYRTTFDLTGFNLSSVKISGKFTSDNAVTAIKVNDGQPGVSNPTTGIAGSGNFAAFSTFTLTAANSTFVDGINTIDFYVTNADAIAGYTGLRVEELQGFGIIPAATAPHIAVPPYDTTVARNATTCLMVSASGSATLTYQWTLNGNDISGATNAILPITADNFNKEGTYRVKVTNGVTTVTSDPAVLTITNAAPVAVADTASTAKNTALILSTLKGNDTDADLDTLTITGVTAGTGGTVSLGVGGVVTFTPTLNFVGTATFTYAINDGWGGTATGNVSVTVADTLPPTFSGYAFGTPKNTGATVGIAKILSNAADADGGTPALSSVASTSAQGGTVAVSGSNIIYTPPSNFTGLDTFAVTIADGQGGVVVGNVTVNVTDGSGQGQNQAILTILPGGNVAVLFMGIPNQSYQIQRSTDLLTWTTLQTVSAGADGTLPFTDTAPPVGTAFYRTKVP